MPEKLPSVEDIKLTQKRLNNEQKKKLKSKSNEK